MAKKHTNLCLYFVAVVFMIMFTSAVIMFSVTLWIIKAGLFQVHVRNPIVPISVILWVSVFVGTAISSLISKKILKPITDLNKATKEVAKGNFSIKLDELHKIDEISQMFKNFNTMVHELNSIDTLRNDFVVNVSHEFKTPISAIEGYATLLKDKSLSETEADEYTQMIIESAKQLSTLSSNILKISKLDNQEIISEKNEYYLDEQIRQALLLLENQWSLKNINLNLELDPLIFYGNEELLMQVWLNLLGNAIKFTSNSGDVSTTLKKTHNYIVVTIKDTGIGITNDAQKHIFEKFYQEDNSRSSDGNGLGLTLVKRIVDLCGGSISLKSELGKGSIFTVELPIAKD